MVMPLKYSPATPGVLGFFLGTSKSPLYAGFAEC